MKNNVMLSYMVLLYSRHHITLKKITLDGEGNFEVEFNDNSVCSNVSFDVGYYTLEDLMPRIIFWGKKWGNYKLKGKK